MCTPRLWTQLFLAYYLVHLTSNSMVWVYPCVCVCKSVSMYLLVPAGWVLTLHTLYTHTDSKWGETNGSCTWLGAHASMFILCLFFFPLLAPPSPPPSPPLSFFQSLQAPQFEHSDHADFRGYTNWFKILSLTIITVSLWCSVAIGVCLTKISCLPTLPFSPSSFLLKTSLLEDLLYFS